MDNDDDCSWCSTTHVADVPPTMISRFTDLGNDGPAAIKVIKYLVHVTDVVSFHRNTHWQVSYMAVDRARDILKEINEYIHKVEHSTDME